MKMQRNSVYTIQPSSPPSDSSNSHHATTTNISIQQSPIKPEQEYNCIDETDSDLTHNYSRNHHDEQQEHSLIGNNNQQYHISGNNGIQSGGGDDGGDSGGGGGGDSGGGGSNSGDSDGNSITNNNNNAGDQQSPRNQQNSPTSWHQPTQITHHHHHQQQQQQQHTSTDVQHQIIPPPNAYGMLSHESDILYITESCIEIGRNSSTSSVHFHVAKNSFVSRKHLKVVFDKQSGDFLLICLSKNGVFVDDLFQRKSTEAIKLPKICTFRFPSTEIRIAFESFTDKVTHDVKNNFRNVENSNVIYSPLQITIPKTEQKSPFPSPTGTISAANSCPTSPRPGFQDYHSYNYNNNNSFQNEFFPPPSTSACNEYEKPPYSYAQLIVQSISAAPDKQLTLSGIYSFISKNYPYYRKEANKGWQNSIRHNLSLNRYFIKVARSQDEPGKGSFWRIDPNSEAKLIDQSYKKRRQRGSQCFRAPYGMPRSAPVSPSHIDNSRENSPIHDIVLQSAPGSPGVYHNSLNDNHPGGEEVSSYNSQSLVQPSSYNLSSQYNNASTYYASNPASTITSKTSSTSLGTALKRHQSSTSSGNSGSGQGGSTTVGIGNGGGTNNIAPGNNNSSGIGLSAHGNEIYEEYQVYSDDECEIPKRQKYTTDDVN